MSLLNLIHPLSPYSIYKVAKQNEFLLAILFFTFIFLLININLVRGTVVSIWDSDGQFVAYQTLVADYARSGKLALWDPLTDGGTPISGDPQIGSLSPLNVIIGFLFGGTTLGFRFYWLFIWWLGGLGIIFLGKHVKAPAYGSAVISLGFLFCGIYITNAEHISWLVGFSFLPIIIWRLDVALIYKRLMPALQAGALWGLSALSGYPGFTVLTVLYCGVWAIGRLIYKNKIDIEGESHINNGTMSNRSYFRFVFISLSLSLIVGVLVLSPTYFSFLYENVGTTTRTETLSKEAIIVENPLHLGAISSFASPYIPVQKLHNSNLWVGTDVSMTSIYVGGIISVLALFSLINGSKDKWRWFLLFLALLALACSISNVFPFRAWLYDLVYPTRYFRHSSIFRAYYLFSITILALLGIRDLTIMLPHGSNITWERLKTSAQILAVSAILIFITFINSLTTVSGKTRLAYVHLFVIWGGICLIPYLRKLNKTWNIISLFIIFLAVFDAFCVYRLSSSFIATDDPALVQRWQNLDQNHSSNLDLTKTGLLREESACFSESQSPCTNLNNDQMFKKIPVFNSYNPQVNNFQVEMVKNPVLKNMAINSNRIWFSTQVAQVPPTMENFLRFAQRTSELGVAPLVVHSPQDMTHRKFNSNIISDQLSQNKQIDLENLPPLKQLNINLIKYTPEEFIFETESPSDGWLLVTDRWSRMWKVDVNNQPTGLYGGNFIFRAIEISAGHNTVRFVYRPIIFPYLIVLSWGLLGVIIIVSLYEKILRNNKRLKEIATPNLDAIKDFG